MNVELEGYEAYVNGLEIDANPYEEDRDNYLQWGIGWIKALHSHINASKDLYQIQELMRVNEYCRRQYPYFYSTLEKSSKCQECNGTGYIVTEDLDNSCKACNATGERIMISHLCDCGSGKESEWAYDGQNIPLCRTCEDCEKEKLSRYRPEILEPYTQADVDEPIEED